VDRWIDWWIDRRIIEIEQFALKGLFRRTVPCGSGCRSECSQSDLRAGMLGFASFEFDFDQMIARWPISRNDRWDGLNSIRLWRLARGLEVSDARPMRWGMEGLRRAWRRFMRAWTECKLLRGSTVLPHCRASIRLYLGSCFNVFFHGVVVWVSFIALKIRLLEWYLMLQIAKVGWWFHGQMLINSWDII
jgi:hypothetical protein